MGASAHHLGNNITPAYDPVRSIPQTRHSLRLRPLSVHPAQRISRPKAICREVQLLPVLLVVTPNALFFVAKLSTVQLTAVAQLTAAMVLVIRQWNSGVPVCAQSA